MKQNLRWINIFIRDILITFLLTWVNYQVNFKSWWVACLIGMQIVLVTWHLSDFLENKRSIEL